jgi:hypothetical protein
MQIMSNSCRYLYRLEDNIYHIAFDKLVSAIEC